MSLPYSASTNKVRSAIAGIFYFPIKKISCLNHQRGLEKKTTVIINCCNYK